MPWSSDDTYMPYQWYDMTDVHQLQRAYSYIKHCVAKICTRLPNRATHPPTRMWHSVLVCLLLSSRHQRMPTIATTTPCCCGGGSIQAQRHMRRSLPAQLSQNQHRNFNTGWLVFCHTSHITPTATKGTQARVSSVTTQLKGKFRHISRGNRGALVLKQHAPRHPNHQLFPPTIYGFINRQPSMRHHKTCSTSMLLYSNTCAVFTVSSSQSIDSPFGCHPLCYAALHYTSCATQLHNAQLGKFLKAVTALMTVIMACAAAHGLQRLAGNFINASETAS